MMNLMAGFGSKLFQGRWAGLIWHEGARVAQIVMESAWFTLWLLAPLQHHGKIQFSTLTSILVGICLGGYLVALGLNQSSIKSWQKRLLFLGWLWFLLWLVQKWILYPELRFSLLDTFIIPYRELLRLNDIPPNIWLILAGCVAGLRGILLARHHAGIFSVRNSFRIGLLFLIFYGLLETNPALHTIYLPAALFLGSGLICLSSTRLAEMTREKGGRLLDLGPRWFILIIAFVSALLLVSFGLDALISWQLHPVREVVIFLLAAVMTLVAVPFLVVSLGLAYLLLPVLNYILKALHPVFSGWNLQFNELDKNIPPVQFLNRVIDLKPVALYAVIAGILLIILVLVGVNRRSRGLGFPAAPLMDIRIQEGVEDRKGWFRRRLGQTWNSFNRRFRISEARKLWASARIRWVYFRLMQLMSSLGHPRPASTTPVEFLPEMRTWFPDHISELQTITEAYLLVRYGEIPETEEEVQKSLHAWEKLQKFGKLLLKEKADRIVR